MSTPYLRVKNWEKFQHYKDRSPPWIKLHRDLLNDYEFACLQDASKLHLMMIWLLASQMDNRIPADQEFIRKKLNLTGKINFDELIDKGFLECDSMMLARRKQSAMPEREGEGYSKEAEAQKHACAMAAQFESFWEGWKPVEMSKGSKQDAAKSFYRALKGTDYETLIRARDQYLANCRFIQCKTKHASSWLNGRGWENDDATRPIEATGGGGHGAGVKTGKPTALELAMADKFHG